MFVAAERCCALGPDATMGGMWSQDAGRCPVPTSRQLTGRPKGPPGTGLLALQRSIGNRAVTAALSVQRVKLSNGVDTDDMRPEQLVGLYLKAKGGSKNKTSFKAFKSGSGKKHPKPLLLKKSHTSAPLTARDLNKIKATLRRLANNQEFIAEADDDVMDAVDEIVGGVPAFTGTEGGFGEHGFTSDSTYFEKIPSLRPDKGSALFKEIYLDNAVKTSLPGAPELLGLACQEPVCTLGGTVYFEAVKPWREYDVKTNLPLSKAPPVCHKTPYRRDGQGVATSRHRELDHSDSARSEWLGRHAL